MKIKQFLAWALIGVLLVAAPASATTFYSTEITNSDQTVPPVKNDPNKNNRVTENCWTYTGPSSSTPASGDTIELVKIPSRSRVLGITYQSNIQTGTGIDLGVSASTTQFVASAALSSIGVSSTPSLNGGGFMSQTSTANAATTVLGTVKSSTWGASAYFNGCIRYLAP